MPQGVLAKKEDLMLAFGTDNTEVVCLKILAEGEMQASATLLGVCVCGSWAVWEAQSLTGGAAGKL